MNCETCGKPIRATAGHEVIDDVGNIKVWHKKCWAPILKAEKLAEQNPPKKLFLGAAVHDSDLSYRFLASATGPLPVRVAEGQDEPGSQGRNAVYLVQEDGHETSGVWLSPEEARRLKKWLQDHGY